MTTLKTTKNNLSVSMFISDLEGKQKKKDSTALVKIFESATGHKATMWGYDMIGFGSYQYKSHSGKQTNEWPLTAFSPKGKNISIYLMPGVSKFEKQLEKLGKHKVSKGSCLYIKRLEDVDLAVLEKIITLSVKGIKQMYPDKT